MALVVQKYGGSSLASTASIKAVAGEVARRHAAGDRMVVVVSAMGKTTDELLARAEEISSTPSRRELDMLVTVGERITMALMSLALNDSGVPAVSFTGSQSGIITEDVHQGARIVEIAPLRIHAALEQGRVAIVAGYQGMSRRREVTTLGRGGSDTTAVALAAALAADSCEIFSDVDGVYSADPRICEQARLIREISYETMQTIAGAGAKVLNAAAVEFARRAGITIRARKSLDLSDRETLVFSRARSTDAVSAVVGAEAVSIVRVAGKSGATVAQECARTGGRIMRMRYAETSCAIWIDRTGIAERTSRALVAIAEAVGGAVQDVSIATVVGTALTDRPDLLMRAEAALEEAQVEVGERVVEWGSIGFVLPSAAHRSAVAALHRELLERVKE